MTIDLSGDTTGFFQERLAAALGRHGLSATAETEVYLLHLLTAFAHGQQPDALSRPLVERLAEALAEDRASQRFRRFRDLGDSALYACGFFADHLERKGISRKYVVTMGGRAYVAAGDLAARSWGEPSGFATIYPELAGGFERFAAVLSDVRESTSLRTPQDIIRLYERWRRTRSPLLAERLEQQGVFPQASSGRPTLH